ncbi:Na/Pi cotransporter family protein [Galenea microaerophila]
MPENSVISIDWFNLIVGFSGGLALFLYGMQQLVKALVSVAGNQLKYFLAKLTTNRFTGAISGAVATAIIQSSSITTVLTVSFVSAGLMTLSQAAGVIMGANLGTTVTAQILSFELDHLAFLMIVFGVLFQFLAERKRLQDIGLMLLGLGLIFYGMQVMSDAMSPLRNYAPFIEAMKTISHPFYGIVLGFIFTALVQSSSAAVGLVIVLASDGFISLPAGIALILGANLGTTVTALLASIGANRDAVRAALIHFEFNLFGVLIWLPFIPELAHWAQWMTFENLQSMTQSTPREIANAHTLFNFINLLVFLPLIPIFVKSVYQMVPLKPEEKRREPIKPKYLDDSLLTSPTLALEAVHQELGHFQGKFLLLMQHINDLIYENSIQKLSEQTLLLNQLENYQTDIVRFLGKISQSDLKESEQQTFMQLMQALTYIDAMLETLDSELLNVLKNMSELEIQPSDTMKKWLSELANETQKALDKAFSAVVEGGESGEGKAMQVLAAKANIDHLIQEVFKHQAKNLKSNDERITIFRHEMQLINGFKRLYTLAKRLARLALTENQ